MASVSLSCSHLLAATGIAYALFSQRNSNETLRNTAITAIAMASAPLATKAFCSTATLAKGTVVWILEHPLQGVFWGASLAGLCTVASRHPEEIEKKLEELKKSLSPFEKKMEQSLNQYQKRVGPHIQEVAKETGDLLKQARKDLPDAAGQLIDKTASLAKQAVHEASHLVDQMIPPPSK